MSYRIKDWSVHFENAASRKLKRLDSCVISLQSGKLFLNGERISL